VDSAELKAKGLNALTAEAGIVSGEVTD